MRVVYINIDDIYVPAAKRRSFEAEKVEPLAEDILENGLNTPIYIRKGKDRYVLQDGLHRVEAMKMLGETRIAGHIIQAPKH
jgi:ParB-like chromosome segregation protein Spo0J